MPKHPRVFAACVATVALTLSAMGTSPPEERTAGPAGAILYVDADAPEPGSGWDGVNGHAYTGKPGTGKGYSTVQAAADAMSPGDQLYLRGGTYRENHSDKVAVLLLPRTSGNPENYSSIESYPGEWAVLNPEGRSYAVIGMPDTDWKVSSLRYWRFERLEITGGDGVGIYATTGPFVVRYCYIHDNIKKKSDGSNIGGLKGGTWADCVVEYSVFRDNGYGDSNGWGACIGPQIMSDYKWRAGTDADNPVDPEHCLRSNTIRYNLFLNTWSTPASRKLADSGIHNKADQLLTPHTRVKWANRKMGDDVHHNVFLNIERAFGCQQDFAQFHHNIVCNATGPTYVEVHDPAAGGDATATVLYNNTVVGGVFRNNFDVPVSGPQRPASKMIPYIYMYNNIIDNPPYWDNNFPINIGYTWAKDGLTYDPDRVDVRHNYVCRMQDSRFGHRRIRVMRSDYGPAGFGPLSFAEYARHYGAKSVNWDKTSSEGADNLFEGAEGPARFKARGAHEVSKGVTVATGGTGEGHPYLDGVRIPAYLGAANPNKDSGAKWDPEHPDPDDAGWVDYVLGLEKLFKAVAGNNR